jgi:hypothetical protein
MNSLHKQGTHHPQDCTGDSHCACRQCLDEMAAERRARGWRDEWFGLPPKLEVTDAPELTVWGAAL